MGCLVGEVGKVGMSGAVSDPDCDGEDRALRTTGADVLEMSGGGFDIGNGPGEICRGSGANIAALSSIILAL